MSLQSRRVQLTTQTFIYPVKWTPLYAKQWQYPWTTSNPYKTNTDAHFQESKASSESTCLTQRLLRTLSIS